MEEKAERRVVAVITHGGHDGPARLLVEPEGTGWRLPEFRFPPDDDGRVLAPGLRAAVAERFGLAVALLSLLSTQRDEATGARTSHVALEADTVPKDGTEPAGSVWLGWAGGAGRRGIRGRAGGEGTGWAGRTGWPGPNPW